MKSNETVRIFLSSVSAHTVKEKYAAVKIELPSSTQHTKWGSHYEYPVKCEALYGFCGLQDERIGRFANN